MASTPARANVQESIDRAIDLLKVDLPTLFSRDIDYSIYARNIYFKDPVNTFKYKFNYRIIFWTLRFHAQLFFSEIFFDVHDIRQEAENIVKVDWTVRGTLRLPWKSRLFFNGDSTYTFNDDGLISDHRDCWDRSPGKILKQFLPNQPDPETLTD